MKTIPYIININNIYNYNKNINVFIYIQSHYVIFKNIYYKMMQHLLIHPPPFPFWHCLIFKLLLLPSNAYCILEGVVQSLIMLLILLLLYRLLLSALCSNSPLDIFLALDDMVYADVRFLEVKWLLNDLLLFVVVFIFAYVLSLQCWYLPELILYIYIYVCNMIIYLQ